MPRFLHASLLLACAGLLAPGIAHADIYKCVDDQGHTTYTNDRPAQERRKQCTLMTREQPVSTVSPIRSSSTPTPANFPRVDQSTQKRRDDDRLRILETELDSESKQLETARKELTEQESVRLGDERNYQRYLDRIKTYKDKVELHERNIEAINREISKLR
ncbi:MAG: hypothetical protein CGU28_00690 [Candidatus Dactylopiibacterium carminicum]|uniref:DUF4124 domain-containing protein n=1 Tax=Candidatus Dactylopiibacterium carminicum TaxID=857335 RepID=A0A272EYS5_9RHOO|nr:DUF4124 domain-containing protein [Candidatus Dactylopiibacterium carminicum]KAF7600789.1 DUF4124 domain-containing protein [Candidatus Dactylopiibacterium carminicum]PAS95288.1 MAG: hypothetical protein CGU29_00120 [Candidatus Dactylopiibacterium carminicum]PAS98701.1 MAG: hypothetical protein CGU28_00690 [Candidatus Dactylopiibacterium carminicum]PAT00796.1 MAG: hypothetical protein BSR46_00085 [Candidatus Dactylopiibacterium carminicum]